MRKPNYYSNAHRYIHALPLARMCTYVRGSKVAVKDDPSAKEANREEVPINQIFTSSFVL